MRTRWALAIFASIVLAGAPSALANHPAAPSPVETVTGVVDEVAGGAETCVPSTTQDAAADESLVCDTAANVKSVVNAVQGNAPDPASPEEIDPLTSANGIATAVFAAVQRQVGTPSADPLTPLADRGDVGDSASAVANAVTSEVIRQRDHADTLRQTVQNGAFNAVDAVADMAGSAAGTVLDAVCRRPGSLLPPEAGGSGALPDPTSTQNDPLNAARCNPASVGENVRTLIVGLITRQVAGIDNTVQNVHDNIEALTGINAPEPPSICQTAGALCGTPGPIAPPGVPGLPPGFPPELPEL